MFFSKMNSRDVATFLAHRATPEGRCELCGSKLTGSLMACEYSDYAFRRLGIPEPQIRNK